MTSQEEYIFSDTIPYNPELDMEELKVIQNKLEDFSAGYSSEGITTEEAEKFLDWVTFNARSSNSLDGGMDPMLFVLKEGDSSVAEMENPSHGIRPVVTLNSDILNELITATETDSTLGNGESSETAWDLDAYLSANS